MLTRSSDEPGRYPNERSRQLIPLILFVLFGAVAGAWIGFSLLFYGFLLFYPPGPSQVEFEVTSPLGFYVGGLMGVAIGSIAGYRLGHIYYGDQGGRRR